MVLRRVGTSIPVLLVVSALTFVLERLAPGDPAVTILGPSGTPEQYRALRIQLGLNDPVWQQYLHWLSRAARGDLGVSLFSGEPVVSIINQRLGVTLSLVVGAISVTALLGITLGVVSAVRGGWLGRLLDLLSLTTFAIPNFWLGMLLVAGFAVALPLFPATGYTAWADSPSGWFDSLVLPVTALAVSGTAAVAKQTHGAMLDVMQSDFVHNLRINGISERSVIWKHGLKNAAIPVVTVLGLYFIALLSGTVVVETVFSMPGLGSLAVQATTDQDIPMIQGVAVYVTVLVVVVNLLLDIAYGWLNPKARVS
jgi:peptide/nickel transport system permease protein